MALFSSAPAICSPLDWPELRWEMGGTMATCHFERALFVVGEPNSGKSNQLRSMFRDIRLGNTETFPRKGSCLISTGCRTSVASIFG
jgi:hypothetical protein